MIIKSIDEIFIYFHLDISKCLGKEQRSTDTSREKGLIIKSIKGANKNSKSSKNMTSADGAAAGGMGKNQKLCYKVIDKKWGEQ